MDPSTLAAYDSASARFAQEWREQPAPEDMYQLLKRYLWMRENGFDASGYDASAGLLREARATCPQAFFGLSRLPELEGVPRGTFANVLCETVIMHLDPAQIGLAVRNLVSLLAPGGTMWLSWRVTPTANRRDAAGRLYASFDDRIVLSELSETTTLLDREERSGSSGKIVRRLIVRRPAD